MDRPPNAPDQPMRSDITNARNGQPPEGPGPRPKTYYDRWSDSRGDGLALGRFIGMHRWVPAQRVKNLAISALGIFP